MKFRNLKIRSKLILSFSIILILFLISTIAALINVNKVANSLEDFYNQPFAIVDISWNMKYSLLSAERSIYKAATENDLELTKTYIQDARNYLNTLENSLVEIENVFSGDKQLISDFRNIIGEAIPVGKQILEFAAINKNSEALELMKLKYNKSLQQATNILDEISSYSDGQTKAFYKDSQNTKLTSIIMLLSITALSIILSITISARVTRSIINPIAEIKKSAFEMSKGNLGIDVHYQSNDEIGNLADIIREMTKTLRLYVNNIEQTLGKLANKDLTANIEIEYLGDFAPMKASILNIVKSFNSITIQLEETSKKVSDGAQNIAKISETIAESSSNQSNSIEELVITVNEVTEHVNLNSQNAQNVSTLSTNSVNEIEKGNNYMKNLLKAMDEITLQSNEISNIIKVIDEISNQTNLLSLNASIEAARAGEAGAGFAIVANEIGKLASESGEAAKNTAELITNSIRSVKEGAKLADETAEILKEVVNSSTRTNTLVTEIAQACKQQSTSLNEILEGIQQIAETGEINSSTTQVASASSEELLYQADSLKQMLSAFTVN